MVVRMVQMKQLLVAQPSKALITPRLRPLPMPSITTSMKMPQPTPNMVSRLRSLLRLRVCQISLQRSLSNMGEEWGGEQCSRMDGRLDVSIDGGRGSLGPETANNERPAAEPLIRLARLQWDGSQLLGARGSDQPVFLPVQGPTGLDRNGDVHLGVAEHRLCRASHCARNFQQADSAVRRPM